MKNWTSSLQERHSVVKAKISRSTFSIQQLETTNRSLEVVTAQNKKQDDRLTALEKAPGVFGNKLWWAVIAALIAGFVASELARYLH